MLAFFILTMIAALDTQARAENVALMIWVDDGKALDHVHQLAAIQALRQASPDLPIRALTTTKHRAERDLNEVERVLAPNDEVSVLMLATHGGTQIRKNRTQLLGLGTFGTDGATGPLKTLITHLGTRWAPKVHVFLNACSTCRGTTSAVEGRLRGLTRDFNSVGVRDVSIWGAHQDLRASGYRERNTGYVVKDVAKKIALLLAPGPVLGAVVLPSIWAFSGFDPEIAQRLVRAAKLMGIVYGAVVAHATLVYAWAFLTDGQGGYLFTSNEGVTELVEMEAGAPAVQTGSCATEIH